MTIKKINTNETINNTLIFAVNNIIVWVEDFDYLIFLPENYPILNYSEYLWKLNNSEMLF